MSPARHGARRCRVHWPARWRKAAGLVVAAAEQLDQQGAADVEGLVHDGVHLGVHVHLLAGDIAQYGAQTLRRQDEERQDGHAEQGKSPLQGEHDRQYGDASTILVMMPTMVLLMAFCAPTTSLLRRLISSPTLVLVKKRRLHALQARKQCHPQIVDDAFADGGVQAALEDVDQAADDGDTQQGDRQPDQPVEIPGGDRLVDQSRKISGESSERPVVNRITTSMAAICQR